MERKRSRARDSHVTLLQGAKSPIPPQTTAPRRPLSIPLSTLPPIVHPTMENHTEQRDGDGTSRLGKSKTQTNAPSPSQRFKPKPGLKKPSSKLSTIQHNFSGKCQALQPLAPGTQEDGTAKPLALEWAPSVAGHAWVHEQSLHSNSQNIWRA
jgi:hypothetical protein